MENNYNEWNPNGANGTAQDNIDEQETSNASESTRASENANQADVNYASAGDYAENTQQTEGTKPAGSEPSVSPYQAENGNIDSNASGNNASGSYQQTHNPYQQYHGASNGQQPYGTQASGYGAAGQAYGQSSAPYGTQANQTYGTGSQPYGTQQAAYGTGSQPYGTQQAAYGTGSQPYGTQRAAYGTGSQPYGTQRTGYGTTGQSYGTPNSAYGTGSQPYGTQQAPYGQPVKKARKAKKEKKSGGLGSMLGKAAAVALVFGLVAGLVFSGVSYGLGNALGTNSASSDSGIATNTVSTVSTSGEASDLVDVSSIVDAVMPSIVAVTNFSTVTTSSMFGTYSYESESLGSGIIIAQTDDYLYICTNNHVVSGAETLTVQFVDDSTVSAEITGTDAADDLAVIQVAISSISSDTLAAISIAQVDDSGDLAVGEATIAIGNSLGYGQSVTTGVISALGRTISVSDETTGETTVCTNLIQTDAAINAGNSGGALLNSSGAVIGINSAKYSDTGVEGMGYAIPMSDAWSIIEALIAGEDIPQSAYLGISGQSVSTDVASVYGVPEGVLVVEVFEGTAADNAGILSGDIITKFEGEELTSMDELKTALAAYKEGDIVTLTVAHKSQGYAETEVTVTLGASTSGD